MLQNKLIDLRHALVYIEKWIGSLSLLLLLLFSLLQIIARNFFDTGFPTLEILNRHLVLFITFMGAALISENNNHIKIDILSHLLNAKQKQKQILLRPLFLFSAIICALLAWYATQFWLDEWNYVADHEKWSVLLALILPLGFIIMSLHLLLLSISPFNKQQTLVS